MRLAKIPNVMADGPSCSIKKCSTLMVQCASGQSTETALVLCAKRWIPSQTAARMRTVRQNVLTGIAPPTSTASYQTLAMWCVRSTLTVTITMRCAISLPPTNLKSASGVMQMGTTIAIQVMIVKYCYVIRSISKGCCLQINILLF